MFVDSSLIVVETKHLNFISINYGAGLKANLDGSFKSKTSPDSRNGDKAFDIYSEKARSDDRYRSRRSRTLTSLSFVAGLDRL